MSETTPRPLTPAQSLALLLRLYEQTISKGSKVFNSEVERLHIEVTGMKSGEPYVETFLFVNEATGQPLSIPPEIFQFFNDFTTRLTAENNLLLWKIDNDLKKSLRL